MHNYSTAVEKKFYHTTQFTVHVFGNVKTRVAGSSHDRSTEGSTEDMQPQLQCSMFLMEST